MRISLFIVACILFVIASVVILGKADVLIPGLRKIRTEILSKRDLRGVRTVTGIEYLLISVSTLAVGPLSLMDSAGRGRSVHRTIGRPGILVYQDFLSHPDHMG